MGSTMKDLRNASLPRRGMKSLRENVGELLRSVDSDQAEVTILDCLVGEVLPSESPEVADVNVLRSFPSSDNVVAPFDARVVVFVDWRPFLGCEPHVFEEATEVDDFNSR
jgi:hypothetical protein